MNTLHGIGLAFWRCYAAEASFLVFPCRSPTTTNTAFPSHDETCLDSCIYQTSMELARASRIPETKKMAHPVLSSQNCVRVCFTHFRSLGKSRDKSAQWNLSGSWINICIRFKNVWSRCMIVDLLLSPSCSPCECRCLLLFHCIIVRLTDGLSNLAARTGVHEVRRPSCFFFRLALYASFVVFFCSIASWSVRLTVLPTSRGSSSELPCYPESDFVQSVNSAAVLLGSFSL